MIKQQVAFTESLTMMSGLFAVIVLTVLTGMSHDHGEVVAFIVHYSLWLVLVPFDCNFDIMIYMIIIMMIMMMMMMMMMTIIIIIIIIIIITSLKEVHVPSLRWLTVFKGDFSGFRVWLNL